MTAFRSLCVFCGSKLGNDPGYQGAAQELGAAMASRDIELVYGGGRIGIMGVLAETVLAGGGRVIGVIPDFLLRYEVGNLDASELVVTETMHDRKREMFERADGFVILPGGLGTLEEAFEIITWKQLRVHSKPIVVLDVGAYWRPFADLVERTIDAGFAHPAVAELFTIVDTVEEVFTALAEAPEPKPEVLTDHL
jgi:uncharacterized protein (TIGR00730 family)